MTVATFCVVHRTLDGQQIDGIRASHFHREPASPDQSLQRTCAIARQDVTRDVTRTKSLPSPHADEIGSISVGLIYIKM
jgi:hypothetical protein